MPEPSRVRRLVPMLAALVADAPLFVTAPLYRRRHLDWGATGTEAAAAMVGDDLLPRTGYRSTRAISIAVPPERVWPWLVQMGHGRAGFYSHDLIDNLGRPSATTILAEHQHVEVGQWIPMRPGQPTERRALRVHSFEPGRSLVWTMPQMTWAWLLVPAPGGGTRLVTRLRCAYDWRRRPLGSLLAMVALETGDFAMFRRMLLNIKWRAEHCAPATAAPATAAPATAAPATAAAAGGPDRR